MRKLWTEEKEQIFINEYKTVDDLYLCEKLGVGMKSLRAKRIELMNRDPDLRMKLTR